MATCETWRPHGLHISRDTEAGAGGSWGSGGGGTTRRSRSSSGSAARFCTGTRHCNPIPFEFCRPIDGLLREDGHQDGTSRINKAVHDLADDGRLKSLVKGSQPFVAECSCSSVERPLGSQTSVNVPNEMCVRCTS